MRANGQLAAVVGGGVLSDIDHSDGKRFIGAIAGRHRHGRVGVHRRTAYHDPEESPRSGTTPSVGASSRKRLLHFVSAFQVTRRPPGR